MSTPDSRLRLTLTLDLEVEPLSGELVDGDFRYSFEGWLALASGIERVRRLHSGPPADRRDAEIA